MDVANNSNPLGAGDEILPTAKIGHIEEIRRPGWLIDDLWLASACGIIGAQPKCCKSWLGIDMAVSVASGTPCLGRFEIIHRGPTLIFMAEDRIEEVQDRVQGICGHRGIDISTLDVSAITSPALRLDGEHDQKRLYSTVEQLKPRLLLLDPMVRLHRLDENNARDIAGFLGFLRELERSFGVSIVLTHHSGKRGTSRPGQGLRGSSDLHAYGDSNLYLSRHDDVIEVVVEHRSASAIEPFRIRLASQNDRPHLELIDPDTRETDSPELSDRLKDCLREQGIPMTRQQLRQSLRVNNQRLGLAIKHLVESGELTYDDHNIALVRPS